MLTGTASRSWMLTAKEKSYEEDFTFVPECSVDKPGEVYMPSCRLRRWGRAWASEVERGRATVCRWLHAPEWRRWDEISLRLEAPATGVPGCPG